MPSSKQYERHFPTAAGVLFGLGLGGFLNGIILRQILQWHRMLSSWYPLDTIEHFELNTRWNGIFYLGIYLLVVAGLLVLWRTARHRHLYWSTKLLVGTVLMGFGAFNMVEGVLLHHLLGVHHVNELVEPEYRPFWDIGFILCGAVMFVVGRTLWKRGLEESHAPRRPRPASN